MAEISVSEYARRRNVSMTAVFKLIREGKLSKTAGGKINESTADTEWAANRSPHRTSKMSAASTKAAIDEKVRAPVQGQNQGAGAGYNEARTKREYLRLETDRLKLLKLKGALVDVTEVEVAAFNQSRAERDALLNWPARVVPTMAAEAEDGSRNSLSRA